MIDHTEYHRIISNCHKAVCVSCFSWDLLFPTYVSPHIARLAFCLGMLEERGNPSIGTVCQMYVWNLFNLCLSCWI